jgi:hypothetical protein
MAGQEVDMVSDDDAHAPVRKRARALSLSVCVCVSVIYHATLVSAGHTVQIAGREVIVVSDDDDHAPVCKRARALFLSLCVCVCVSVIYHATLVSAGHHHSVQMAGREIVIDNYPHVRTLSVHATRVRSV